MMSTYARNLTEANILPLLGSKGKEAANKLHEY